MYTAVCSTDCGKAKRLATSAAQHCNIKNSECYHTLKYQYIIQHSNESLNCDLHYKCQMFQSGISIATRSLCCLAHTSQDSIKHAATCSRIPQKCRKAWVTPVWRWPQNSAGRDSLKLVCQVARCVSVGTVQLQLHFNSS